MTSLSDRRDLERHHRQRARRRFVHQALHAWMPRVAIDDVDALIDRSVRAAGIGYTTGGAVLALLALWASSTLLAAVSAALALCGVTLLVAKP